MYHSWQHFLMPFLIGTDSSYHQHIIFIFLRIKLNGLKLQRYQEIALPLLVIMAGLFCVTKFSAPRQTAGWKGWAGNDLRVGGRDTRHYTRFLLAIISSMAYATLFTPPVDHSLALPRVLRKAMADTQCSASEWKSVVVENVGGKMRNLWATTRPRVRGSWGPGSGCAFVFMQHLWCHLQFSNIVVLLKEL